MVCVCWDCSDYVVSGEDELNIYCELYTESLLMVSVLLSFSLSLSLFQKRVDDTFSMMHNTDPRQAPLIPRALVGPVARICFHLFTLSLIYSTIAMAVTIETLGNYWFVVVGDCFVVLAVSYGIATIMRFVILRSLSSNHHSFTSFTEFHALRIAVTFPNIVALPILIFPSLCEYPVVYKGYILNEDNLATHNNEDDQEEDESFDDDWLQRQCVAQATTMIFCYFFSWSLAFWTFGNSQLLKSSSLSAANKEDTNDQVILSTQNDIGTSAQQRQGGQIGEENSYPNDNTNESTFCNLKQPNRNHGIDSRTKDRLGSQSGESQGDAVNRSLEDSSCSEGEPGNVLLSPAATVESGKETIHRTINHPTTRGGESDDSSNNNNSKSCNLTNVVRCWSKWSNHIRTSLYQTFTSPGFVAMILGFVTACIPPLQKALFQGGGSLRFLGSALETLGSASTSLSTIVVAASLVPPLSAPLTSPSNANAHAKPADTVQPEESSDSMPYLTLVDEERCNDPEQQQEDEQDDDDVDHVLDTCDFSSGTSRHKEEHHVRDNNNNHPINLRHNHTVDDHECSTDLVVVYEENPVMTDPNFGPYQRKKRRWQLSGRFCGSRSSSRQQEERRSSLWTTNTTNPSLMFQLGRSFRSRSVRWLQTAVHRSRSEMGQLHLWFNLSRLVLTPAVIVGLILALDCVERRGGGGLLSSVPNLAKLVLIINAALPGALIVIVMLKSNPHLVSADTAATVAKAYLPQYLLSIFSIAAWTALGQYITLPDDDGYRLCQQEQRRP